MTTTTNLAHLPRILDLAPARTLTESTQHLQLEPLSPDSPFYEELEQARGTLELAMLKKFLIEHGAVPKAWARCAFVGERGSGKSTYLLNLENKLRIARQFTPVHIYLDAALETDCDYSDLFLWMVEQIASQFDSMGHPVNAEALAKITYWFADISLSKTEEWKKEFGIETSVEAKAGLGLPMLGSLKILARMKSMISGNQQSRKEIRQQLQNRSTELLDHVNEFLDHARDVLRTHNKPDRLLIVQDNLDRLRPREKAREFFENGADMLRGLRADVIYTAPLAINAAPLNLQSLLGIELITMPNVKLRMKDGTPHVAGMTQMLALVNKRISIAHVFENEDVAKHIIESSGGSVRDLLRLLEQACAYASVNNKTKIDLASAESSRNKTKSGFQRVLVPLSSYFPLLASIHLNKGAFDTAEPVSKKSQADDALEFYADLIANGSILEYNGEDSWYDVHPCVQQIPAFQNALSKLQASTV